MRLGLKLCVTAFSIWSIFPQPVSSDDVIRIGIISTTFGYAPVFVGKEKGFFKREGLYPEIVVISRNEQIVQALISDSLQFGNVPPNLLFVLRQQGSNDIKLIAGSFNGTTYSLIALAKYKKMEDLKGGTRLAMSGITSAAALMMKQMLKERGVLYPRDYIQSLVDRRLNNAVHRAAERSGERRFAGPATQYHGGGARSQQSRRRLQAHARLPVIGDWRPRRVGAKESRLGGALSEGTGIDVSLAA